jgi:hypothetical protein
MFKRRRSNGEVAAARYRRSKDHISNISLFLLIMSLIPWSKYSLLRFLKSFVGYFCSAGYFCLSGVPTKDWQKHDKIRFVRWVCTARRQLVSDLYNSRFYTSYLLVLYLICILSTRPITLLDFYPQYILPYTSVRPS